MENRFKMCEYELKEFWIKFEGNLEISYNGRKWKRLPQNENYVVSIEGNIISLSRDSVNSRGHVRRIKSKVLKPYKDKKGYDVIRICNEGHAKSYKVHQLVAMTFLSHKPSGMSRVVDHINNNKNDNRLSNLQIITTRENGTKDAKGGSSKYAGVVFSKEKGKWRSTIENNNKKYHLGYFESEERASEYYNNALDCILSGNEKDIKIKRRNTSSIYKGVSKTKNGRYRAAFRFNNKFYGAGVYEIEGDAYKAYLKLYNKVVHGK